LAFKIGRIELKTENGRATRDLAPTGTFALMFTIGGAELNTENGRLTGELAPAGAFALILGIGGVELKTEKATAVVQPCVGFGLMPTLNPAESVAVCAPVLTVTLREPVDAAGSMTNCATATVALETVTGPKFPEAAPPTDTPVPKVATVEP
jgi:hypothetical protein